MKNKSFIILTFVAASLSLMSCENNSVDKVEIANPWVEYSSFEDLGKAIGVTKDLSVLNFKKIDEMTATEKIAQINYIDGSKLRVALTNQVVDITGIYGGVSINYYSIETNADFSKYDNTIYAYWTEDDLEFCYYGIENESIEKVDETVTQIYKLFE